MHKAETKPRSANRAHNHGRHRANGAVHRLLLHVRQCEARAHRRTDRAARMKRVRVAVAVGGGYAVCVCVCVRFLVCGRCVCRAGFLHQSWQAKPVSS